jgi:phenylpropionate dioxygenase-like ring-hydroxylating dioxygenase large terminal subunit
MNAYSGSQPLTTLDPARYLSRAYAQQEKRSLWPRVWQIACREEEIPAPGDFITYEVCDESVIVARVRSGNIIAYHNVCPHRGRRLVSGCGKASLFRCGYHGWMFDLDGKNVRVQDKDDWQGGLDGEAIDLHRVRLETWGGFVWIDFREAGESLADYL